MLHGLTLKCWKKCDDFSLTLSSVASNFSGITVSKLRSVANISL